MEYLRLYASWLFRPASSGSHCGVDRFGVDGVVVGGFEAADFETVVLGIVGPVIAVYAAC